MLLATSFRASSTFAVADPAVPSLSGLHHLAFHAQGRHEVNLFYEFLLENNIIILDPPAVYDYTPDYYAVFFADPDGLKLEVVHEPNATTLAP